MQAFGMRFFAPQKKRRIDVFSLGGVLTGYIKKDALNSGIINRPSN